MVKVIGVRFRNAGKIYYFAPGKYEIKSGQHVIVETARGIEYGYVVLGTREVEDGKVVQPLKSVIRMATKEDEDVEEANKKKEKDAFKVCLEKIRKHNLEMKLRIAVWAGGFLGGLQKIFQRIVLRDAEKIVLMRFPQVKSYLVYVLLYHIAAKAVIINMGGDKLS